MRRMTRRGFFGTSARLSGVVGAGLGTAHAAFGAPMMQGHYREVQARVTERYVAVDNVGAYASLTQLGDGTLVAALKNRPTHGGPNVDIACWASEDGGRFWRLRGVAAPLEPGTSHLSAAAGVAHDGSLLVLAATERYEGRRRAGGLPPLVCRSSDGGETWERSSAVKLPTDESPHAYFPHGNIVRGPGKTLAVAVYEIKWREEYKRKLGPDKLLGFPAAETAESVTRVLFSHDDGQTWEDSAFICGRQGKSTISPGTQLEGYWFGSPSVVYLGDRLWLAAIDRGYTGLFVSKDDGRTWSEAGPLTLNRQRPGHLLPLADGRVLLTYGLRERDHYGHPPNDLPNFIDGTFWRSRVRPASGMNEDDLLPRDKVGFEPSTHGPGCIAIRWSDDKGESWSWAKLVLHLEECTDGSYPATCQRKDGSFVTVYHADRVSAHHRYHMGVICWELV